MGRRSKDEIELEMRGLDYIRKGFGWMKKLQYGVEILYD